MSLYRPLSLALTTASLIATPALATPALATSSLVASGFAMAGLDQQRSRDQDRAFENKREGRSMPLPMIERRVRPHMGGAVHIGSELKGETTRLKYMQDGHVIWVDVDAATGRIVRRSGD